jgi:hypothetical protein
MKHENLSEDPQIMPEGEWDPAKIQENKQKALSELKPHTRKALARIEKLEKMTESGLDQETLNLQFRV